MKRYLAALSVIGLFAAVVALSLFGNEPPPEEKPIERWDVYVTAGEPRCVQCEAGTKPECDEPLTLIAEDVPTDQVWREYMFYMSPNPPAQNGFTAGPKASGGAR